LVVSVGVNVALIKVSPPLTIVTVLPEIVATPVAEDVKVNVPARLFATVGLPRSNGTSSEFFPHNISNQFIEFERIGVALVNVKIDVALVAEE
jgi:hypothetical protein